MADPPAMRRTSLRLVLTAALAGSVALAPSAQAMEIDPDSLEPVEVPTEFVAIEDPLVDQSDMTTQPAPAESTAAAPQPTTSEPVAADQQQAPAATSRFVPLPPTRVLDTRTGLGADKAKVAPKGSVVLQVTGAGGVPASGVTAVVLNVTLTGASGPGFVQVYPTGRAVEGSSSNLNVQSAGQTVPVLVTAPVGDGGKVTLYTHGGGHLLADVSGYFAASGETAAGRYRPLSPARVLDTRTGVGAPKAAVGRGRAITLQVTGTGGVPSSGVSAVALNVTATGSTAAGFVQVVPSAGGTAAGASSNLNHVARQTVANLVVVPVGDSGAIDLYSSSGTHLLADVAGWFTDETTTASTTGLFVPVAPERLLDTRKGDKPADGGQVAVTPLGRAGVPTSGVSSVVLNVTATLPSAGGFVQVLPTGRAALGSSSNLNLERAGQTVANAAIATLGDGGSVTLYTLRSTHLLADVAGWFTASSSSDGTLPAELQGLRVAPRSDAPYDVAAWPHWRDADGDCQDTAAEAMVQSSVFDATLSDDGCTVTRGLWEDDWTGDQWQHAAEVAVVPTVPLREAHASGGAGWDVAKRTAYANALEHLKVVGVAVAQSRGDRTFESWQPPRDAARCGYAHDWAAVKKAWDLTVTAEELEALKAAFAAC